MPTNPLKTAAREALEAQQELPEELEMPEELPPAKVEAGGEETEATLYPPGSEKALGVKHGLSEIDLAKMPDLAQAILEGEITFKNPEVQRMMWASAGQHAQGRLTTAPSAEEPLAPAEVSPAYRRRSE